MKKLTLPLQVGKKYVTRDGRVATVTGIDVPSSLASLDIDESVWADSGLDGPSREWDVVADCIEPAAEAPKSHVHAALMMEYAKDAMETAAPWLRWEAKTSCGEWVPKNYHPEWNQDVSYRRKPEPAKTILINGFEVPEPLRAAPQVGERFFVPDIFSDRHAYLARWSGSDMDLKCLRRGVAHVTKEAAALHAEALISFTQVTP